MSKTTVGLVSTEKHAETAKLVECPLCKIEQAKFLCDVDGYQIWRCPRCTLDFVSPAPSDEFLQAYYDQQNYFEHCQRGGYEDYDEQTENVIPTFLELLEQYETICRGRYILDVGCAYGTHLALAAERGWRAFGVEVSAHGRQVATKRHGDKISVVDKIEALSPNEFDLILLLDVIEHIKDPFSMFFKLFEKGAIGPKTQIVVTTPNARSCDAVTDPAQWSFRHPPSHLLFYSAEALQVLMRRIRFRNVGVGGLYPRDLLEEAVYDDEFSPANRELQAFAGLLCQASGNDLKAFRHLPKYIFAQKRSRGARVLDFAHGAGYGSALLADTAKEVLAIDIETAPGALHWAPQLQKKSNLKFQTRSDFGKGLAAQSFDLIVCFDTIEHLQEKEQGELLENARRLLAGNGELLISGPLTAGDSSEKAEGRGNSTEARFRDLLDSYFRCVHVLAEVTRSSIVIADQEQPNHGVEFYEWTGNSQRTSAAAPSSYLAICSQRPIRQPEALYSFDSSIDYYAAKVAQEEMLRELQVKCHNLQEIARVREQTAVAQRQTIAGQQEAIAGQQEAIGRQQEALAGRQEAIAKQQEAIIGQEATIATQQGTIHGMAQEIANLQQVVQSRDVEIAAFKGSKIYRLRHTIRNEPWSVVKVIRSLYLVAGMLTPYSIRRRAQPLTARMKKAIANIELKRAAVRTAIHSKIGMIVKTESQRAHEKAMVQARKDLAAKLKIKEKLIFAPAVLDYLEDSDCASSQQPAPQAKETTSRISHVSVVIFSKNASRWFSEVLKGIKAQELAGCSFDLTVIDCCSTDETVRLARQQGATVIQMNPARFDHGLTRNWAFKNTSGDAIVLLGQRAVPGDAQFIEHLVKPLEDPQVACVYGRRVPPPGEVMQSGRILSSQPANASGSKTQFLGDAARYDSLTPWERYEMCNFDSACCAIPRSAWREVPFQAADFAGLGWSKRILESGWKITYQPAAYVSYQPERSIKGQYQQTYSLHESLFELFELNPVPSLYHVLASTVRSTLRDWSEVYKREAGVGKKMRLLAKLPAFNLAIAYAQYRSVQDARTPASDPSLRKHSRSFHL